MDWLDSYYDAIEFFYWEPQHMRAKAQIALGNNALPKFANIRKHLRKMEVTLNHNINQFFLLAPLTLRNDLFKHVFPHAGFGSPFAMRTRDADQDFTLKNCMQPDFVFLSDTQLVSIEMKVASRCKVEQVLKYALLGLAIELKLGKRLEHYFILLGSGEFARQWRGQIDSMAALADRISGIDLGAFLTKQAPHFGGHQERFNEIVKEMNLAFLNYDGISQFLQGAAPSDGSLGAEVYRNLIDGLTNEFKRRELA